LGLVLVAGSLLGVLLLWLLKAKNHYTIFLVASSQQVGVGKSPLTLLCHDCRFPNSITTT